MLNLQTENIPADLMRYPHWVAWKAEEKENGKISKLPIDPKSGRYAKTNDPDTWGIQDDAIARFRDDSLQGIGYVFSEDDPYVGIDLDDCLDPDGTIQPWAMDIVRQFDSYTEYSPSGQGIHILVRGKLPDKGIKKDKVEIYDKGRYFTVTGARLDNTPANIHDRHDLLLGICTDTTRKPERTGLPAELEAITRRARGAKNGWKFSQLFSGNISGYSSQSEADLALCRILAHWTDNDAGKIDTLFRHSGLFREKWDESHRSDNTTYGEITIQKATERNAAVYTETHTAENEAGFKLTDLGNAERLVDTFGNDIKYCHASKNWLIWNEISWREDRTDAINRKAKETVRNIYKEAARAEDSTERRLISKHAEKSESDVRIKAMVSRARSEEGIPVIPEELDRNPWLLNCLNGTLNLKTGMLQLHERNDLITKVAPVEYLPDAECPTWETFLDRIMDGNEELIGFLQRAIGYSLTGDTSEQCIFILYGSGANGKSTFLQAAGCILGDYGIQTPTETFLIKRGGSIPNDVARLRGARLVTASEAESEQRLAESLIKHMTGQDTITARFLHQEWFDFEPTHKIFLGTNHKPEIKGTDYAIWRRIKLVPFEVTIPEPDRDRHLLSKLKGELPGILAWAVRGCLEWQKKGLGEPDEVKAATQNYRTEMDTFAQFINDCCTIEPSAKATSKQIHKAYTEWAEMNGEEKLGIRALGRKLVEQGFKSLQIGKSRARGYTGMGLLSS